MTSQEAITLSRACEVVEIPSGIRSTLPAGAQVRIVQSMGGSYTVQNERGYMYRVDARDADVLGLTSPTIASIAGETTLNERLVENQLKTIYDPEIPVNILDLGLIYSCLIHPLPEGGNRIEVQMSMTAPGCGMGNVLKADVERRLSELPDVKEVQVEIVFDPPWNPGLMTEAAKLQLGFDLDAAPAQPEIVPVVRFAPSSAVSPK